MKISPGFLIKTLHHKRLGNSTGAIAGFVGGLSVIVGFIAARAAPKGFSKISVALHLAKKPFIVRLAPVIAGLAVAIAAVAGIIKFYSWCVEREQDERVDE